MLPRMVCCNLSIIFKLCFDVTLVGRMNLFSLHQMKRYAFVLLNSLYKLYCHQKMWFCGLYEMTGISPLVSHLNALVR